MSELGIYDQEPVMEYNERFLYELYVALPAVDIILLKFYALLGIVKGENTTTEDVLSARVLWIIDDEVNDQVCSQHAEVIKDIARKLGS
jgi:hypothetical protein